MLMVVTTTSLPPGHFPTAESLAYVVAVTACLAYIAYSTLFSFMESARNAWIASVCLAFLPTLFASRQMFLYIPKNSLRVIEAGTVFAIVVGFIVKKAVMDRLGSTEEVFQDTTEEELREIAEIKEAKSREVHFNDETEGKHER